MKKNILLLLLTIVSSVSIFAKSKPVVPEKIQEIFHDEFPTIKNPSFYDFGDYYEVFFKMENNSSERVYYNEDGEIIQTLKYYEASELNPYIRERVNKKYKGKSISGITEMQSKFEHLYQIILKDKNSLYVVKLADNNSTNIAKKFRRG